LSVRRNPKARGPDDPAERRRADPLLVEVDEVVRNDWRMEGAIC
jgi:hypothetical protein